MSTLLRCSLQNNHNNIRMNLVVSLATSITLRSPSNLDMASFPVCEVSARKHQHDTPETKPEVPYLNGTRSFITDLPTSKGSI